MSDSQRVRVRVLQLGRRVVEHAGAPGLTVSSAIEAVGLTNTQGLDLRVNGTPAEGATVLGDGDVVTLIPRIKGGRYDHPLSLWERAGVRATPRRGRVHRRRTPPSSCRFPVGE